MKMLIKERAQVNLSFSKVLDLLSFGYRVGRSTLECHSGHGRDFLHHQICNQLDCHCSIYSLSAPQAHPVNLKVMLEPSPEMLYGVMLLPDGYGFTSSQLPSEDHEAFELRAFADRAIHEEHQYQFAKGWAFRFLSGYWYTFASVGPPTAEESDPGGIIQLYLLLVRGELLPLAIYGEYTEKGFLRLFLLKLVQSLIVALGMDQYLVKALFFEYLHQVMRTIPAFSGDICSRS
jgi:hypothetical protein